MTLSELWASPPPLLANLALIDAGSYFSSGDSLALVELAGTWPRYASSLPTVMPQTLHPASSAPTLVLRGAMDPAAPLDTTDAAAALAGATVITLPTSTGGAALQSATLDGTGVPCGAHLVESFVAHAGDASAIDASCVSRLAPLEFAGHEALAEATFGTSDLWEN